MRLVNKYPGKVQFRLYNTGGMGEIIEETDDHGTIRKTLVRKAERVPLDLMAAIQRGDLRGTNKWEKGILGTESIVEADGRQMEEWDVHNLYNQEQIDFYIKDLIRGRRAFLEEIAKEGLRPELIAAAERSFRAMGDTSKRTAVAATPMAMPSGGPVTPEPRVIIQREEPVKRPRKPGVWRWR
jgi:phosphoenolpyruvate carboxykinase (ATP)